MRRGIARAIKPDGPPSCPGCGRMLALSDVHDGEMTGSCLLDSCRQRVTYRLVDGAWRILERATGVPVASEPKVTLRGGFLIGIAEGTQLTPGDRLGQGERISP
jgi:hypothetical protein